MQKEIGANDGLNKAADLIERVLDRRSVINPVNSSPGESGQHQIPG
jgi:hypothetical protein